MENVEENILLKKKEVIDRLAVPTMEGYTFIPLNVIYFLKASGNYTEIMHIDGNVMKKTVASKRLGYFDDILAHSPFLRIHDSYMVNLTKAIKYFKGKDGSIQLSNGQYLPVSRNKKELLFTVFGI